jgi:hypothetical protein
MSKAAVPVGIQFRQFARLAAIFGEVKAKINPSRPSFYFLDKPREKQS